MKPVFATSLPTTLNPWPQRAWQSAMRLFAISSLVLVTGVSALPSQAQTAGQPSPEAQDGGDCAHHDKHHRGDKGWGPHMLIQAPVIDKMLDYVSANPTQRTQIKHLAQTARNELKPLHENMRTLQEKGLQILGAAQPDEAAAENLRQQMLSNHDQASKKLWQASLAISRVLTPEQRQKWAQHLQEHLQQAQTKGKD